MDSDELLQIRADLNGFANEVFGSLPRKDQRAKSGLYLQGLMLEGRRKSMQPMGGRLGVDYQQLQQFVSSSPWAVEPVRRVLADKVSSLIGPTAWVIDDTAFKKDGNGSPCVARQHSSTLGKTLNCQIGIAVHAATARASCPLNWRLFVPEAWDDTCADTTSDAEHIAARRVQTQIPDSVRHRAKWALSLEMLDELATWGQRPPLICAGAGYGEITEFRLELTRRQIPYIVVVKPSTSVHPAEATPTVMHYSGRGPRPHTVRYQDDPVQAKDLITDAGPDALVDVTWRDETDTDADAPGADAQGAAASGRFAAVRVHPANRSIPRSPDGSLPECWLVVEWPEGETEPTGYWLSTLPDDTPLSELVRLAKLNWRIEHDHRELEQSLGLTHFEGRTWLGWHHHVTLVSAANLFVTSLRLDPEPESEEAA